MYGTLITVLPSLSKVRGLCGNMDGSIVEELRSRRNIEEDVVAFAMSYSDCPAQINKALATVDWCSVNTVPGVLVTIIISVFSFINGKFSL